MSLLKKGVCVSMLCIAVLSLGCRGNVSTYHISQNMDFGSVKRVAVLPLDNLTNERYAGEIVRQVVIGELLASGLVDVIVPGEVIAAIDKIGSKSTSSFTEEQIKTLGSSLKVQAVILGSVERFGEVRVGNISAPEISITLMMADTSSGSIVWSASRTSGGASFMSRHFGARSDTMSESVMKVVRETLRTLSKI